MKHLTSLELNLYIIAVPSFRFSICHQYIPKTCPSLHGLFASNVSSSNVMSGK